MNKIIFFFCLMFSSLLFQVESLPLNLAKTTKSLLSVIGTGTYYDVSVGLGSCGHQSSDSEMVVAVNHGQMNNGANPNNNPHCGKKVKIIGETGKTIMATVVDTCPGCSEGCLDMSIALFKKVCGDPSMGVCDISWDFV
ncbi:RlpA-like double-psi beta-barrel-protein domain-containing protein-containing protein [Gilbertella persicaria]|uniref:RlpA-like double-psi beta-barrel-protein domain-containing protein-containing protein n=1 Tax=Gilbertella persicaria TaxID=101096 RepID=UPI00221F7EDF|nr:RlpA-like double-psi beta-barrel-protein domain-containing protein-containing protein [Gilbertella persicaria]KAI8080812.1 RlpA-like double-psi beta-barrel-protein domain-containing protein-containing protein [Gilbertella persicaria]